MDNKELEREIELFKRTCVERGQPINNTCLKPAYPGDNSTSYILQLQAEWVKDCFDAIDFFTTIMFETMSQNAREKIFSIQVFNSNDKLHCDSGQTDFVANSV